MKKYPLSYTFAWAADAFLKISDEKNPGVTLEGL